MDPEPSTKKVKKARKVKKDTLERAETNKLADLIKGALSMHLEKKRDRKATQDEIEAMVATCEEFMNSFIILGYDFDGNPVDPIVVAHNQQEADSLGAYLNKFISSRMQQPS